MLAIKKTLNFEVKQIGNTEDRVLRFIGSSEAVDRDNDIIEVSGWQLDNYMKNPVFLWAHDYRQPPVGRAINVSKNIETKQLIFDIKFATKEEYPFADVVYNLYLGGYMRATSVGFIPRKYKRRDDDAVLDKPEWQRGYRYVEQELLELSAVPVPSNPEALQIARSKGIDTAEVEKLLQPKMFQLKIDTNNQTISVLDSKSLEELGMVEISDEYKNLLFEQKAGATLSAKNKERLTSAISLLQEIADDAGVNQESGEDEEEGKLVAGGIIKNPVPAVIGDEEVIVLIKDLATQLSQTIKDTLNEVLPKSNETPQADEINLDEIEVSKDTAGGQELSIEPEALKQLMKEVVKEELDRARGKVS